MLSEQKMNDLDLTKEKIPMIAEFFQNTYTIIIEGKLTIQLNLDNMLNLHQIVNDIAVWKCNK